MGKIFLVGIIAVGVLISSEACAITSFGEPDCGTWIKTPTPNRKAWLLGYLSGLNSAVADAKSKYDPLDQLLSADQSFVWMDNYCKNNPLESLSNGGNALFRELMVRAKKQ